MMTNNYVNYLQPLNNNIMPQTGELQFQNLQISNNNQAFNTQDFSYQKGQFGLPNQTLQQPNIISEGNSLDFNNIFSQNDEPTDDILANLGPIAAGIHESIEPYADNLMISKYSPGLYKSSLVPTGLEQPNIPNQIPNVPAEIASSVDINNAYNPMEIPNQTSEINEAPLKSALTLINQDNPNINETNQQYSEYPVATNLTAINEVTPPVQPFTMPPPPPAVQPAESLIVKVPKAQQIIVPQMQNVIVPSNVPIASQNPIINQSIIQPIQVPVSPAVQPIPSQISLIPTQMTMASLPATTIIQNQNATIHFPSSNIQIPQQPIATTPVSNFPASIIPITTTPQIQVGLPTQIVTPLSLPLNPLSKAFSYNNPSQPIQYNNISSQPLTQRTLQITSNLSPGNIQSLPSANILTQIPPIQNNIPQLVNNQGENILGNNLNLSMPRIYNVSTIGRTIQRNNAFPSIKGFVGNNVNDPLKYTTRTYNARRL